MRCFGSLDEVFSVLAPMSFPVTPEEEQVWRSADEAIASACTARGGAILDHMSTANVARDMDLLRQAVGDEQLSYLGFSYGSYLGVTYANMFPDRVGAMVVDGVLDPIAWSTGRGDESAQVPVEPRSGSAAGASATLGEFFRLCDEAAADCAFAGDAGPRFDTLAARLLESPVELTDPFLGTVRVSYADLVGYTLGALYAPVTWPDLAALLAAVEAAASASDVRQRAQELLAGLAAPAPDPQDYRNFVESLPGVLCSESDNPLRYESWVAAARAEDDRNPYFGRPWTWLTSICQPWPGQDADRYAGPWTADTATPVLVVGNLFDPSTPYSGAVVVADLLPNSTLLTYQGWGHTAFGSGNFCVDSTVVQYLISRQTPPDGAVCAAEGSPFGPLEAQSRAGTPSIQAALIPLPIRPRQLTPRRR